MGRQWVSIPAGKRAEIVRVLEEINDAGISLREVWEQFKSQANPVSSVSIGQAIKELLAAKSAANRRSEYLKNLRIVLECFAGGREQMPLSKVTVVDIEDWMRSRKYSPGGRVSAINRLSTLFSWAVKRGYAGKNPCAECERITWDQKTPAILTLDQVRLAVQFTIDKQKGFLPWLVLGLFGGLRPGEADKINWTNIDIAHKTVWVDSKASKIRQRRIVHLMPVAVRLLQTAQGLKVKLPKPPWIRVEYQRALRAELGFSQWPKDILRHTAASYLLAHFQDAALVALELGNSPGMLFKHYRELVTKEDAKKFWNIKLNGKDENES